MKKIKVIFGFVAIIAMMMIQACSSGEGPLDDIIDNPEKPLDKATINVKVTVINNVPDTYISGRIKYSISDGYGAMDFAEQDTFDQLTSSVTFTRAISNLPPNLAPTQGWQQLLGQDFYFELDWLQFNYNNGMAYNKSSKWDPSQQVIKKWNNDGKTLECTFTLNKVD